MATILFGVVAAAAAAAANGDFDPLSSYRVKLSQEALEQRQNLFDEEMELFDNKLGEYRRCANQQVQNCQNTYNLLQQQIEIERMDVENELEYQYEEKKKLIDIRHHLNMSYKEQELAMVELEESELYMQEAAKSWTNQDSMLEIQRLKGIIESLNVDENIINSINEYEKYLKKKDDQIRTKQAEICELVKSEEIIKNCIKINTENWNQENSIIKTFPTKFKSAVDSFEKMNNSVKIPAVLVFMMVISYAFQTILQFLSLDMLASLFTLMLTISISLIILWTYSRYSGNLWDIDKWIDSIMTIFVCTCQKFSEKFDKQMSFELQMNVYGKLSVSFGKDRVKILRNRKNFVEELTQLFKQHEEIKSKLLDNIASIISLLPNQHSSQAYLPEPKTNLSAMNEANNMAAFANAKAMYIREMEQICGGDTPFMKLADLCLIHEQSKAIALNSFNRAKKMGGSKMAKEFRIKLEDEIQISFESFQRMNNSKNLFKLIKTPAVLIMLMVFSYILQGIFQFLWLDMLASIFTLVLMIAFFLLALWTYSRYSGNLQELSKWIDSLVYFLYSNFIAPTFINAVNLINSILASK